MKNILFAAIAAVAFATITPAFADQVHNPNAAAGARGDWRTDQTDGAGAKQYLAAVGAYEGNVAPRVALSDTTAIA